jgi:hypothetical protein
MVITKSVTNGCSGVIRVVLTDLSERLLYPHERREGVAEGPRSADTVAKGFSKTNLFRF